MAITKKLVQVKCFVCFEGKRDVFDSSLSEKKYILGGTWRYSSAAFLNLRRRKERRKDTKKGGKEKKTITKRKRKLSEINTMKVKYH